MFSLLPRRISRSLLPLRRNLATPAELTSIPKAAPFKGLPFEVSATPDNGLGFTPVRLPDMTEDVVVEEMAIPSEPDNYNSTSSLSSYWPTVHLPTVHTVTLPSTHIGGGPSLSTGEEVVLDSVVPLPAKDDISEKPDEFRFEERDLSGEERRGVVVLVGILVGGWLLGGLAGPRKAKKAVV